MEREAGTYRISSNKCLLLVNAGLYETPGISTLVCEKNIIPDQTGVGGGVALCQSHGWLDNAMSHMACTLV